VKNQLGGFLSGGLLSVHCVRWKWRTKLWKISGGRK